MKLLLILIAGVFIAGSFYADYKWRQWITARRHSHQKDR